MSTQKQMGQRRIRYCIASLVPPDRAPWLPCWQTSTGHNWTLGPDGLTIRRQRWLSTSFRLSHRLLRVSCFPSIVISPSIHLYPLPDSFQAFRADFPMAIIVLNNQVPLAPQLLMRISTPVTCWHDNSRPPLAAPKVRPWEYPGHLVFVELIVPSPTPSAAIAEKSKGLFPLAPSHGILRRAV